MFLILVSRVPIFLSRFWIITHKKTVEGLIPTEDRHSMEAKNCLQGPPKDAPKGNTASPSKYPDFAMEPEQGEALDESFPVKLHYMLADLEKDGLDYICSWSRHGR